jgi:Tat protein secretion system quality control protein TatD with DNase activity
MGGGWSISGLTSLLTAGTLATMKLFSSQLNIAKAQNSPIMAHNWHPDMIPVIHKFYCGFYALRHTFSKTDRLVKLHNAICIDRIVQLDRFLAGIS